MTTGCASHFGWMMLAHATGDPAATDCGGALAADARFAAHDGFAGSKISLPA
jgi:hypothetical protein